jgi:hypothetical protein
MTVHNCNDHGPHFPGNLAEAQWVTAYGDAIQISPVPRITDRTRNATVDRLRQAFEDGAIDQAVLEARLGAALSATTQSQLNRLESDLPTGGTIKPASVQSKPLPNPAAPYTPRSGARGIRPGHLALMLIPISLLALVGIFGLFLALILIAVVFFVFMMCIWNG